MSFSRARHCVLLYVTQTLLYSAACGLFSFGQVTCAEAQDTQANKATESFRSTTEFKVDNVSPVRTTESKAITGDGTLEKQHVERIGPDGDYRPYSDTETETIRVNPSIIRVVVRTYLWDASRRRNLVQLTEEESHTLANGDSQLVRTISHADANGNLQLVLREVADTRTTSAKTQQVQTTTYAADGAGGFKPYLRTRELQTRGSDESTDVKKETSEPDGNGEWAIIETEETTTKQDGRIRIIDKQVFRADLSGKVSETSRTVTKETEDVGGEQTKTVESYSVNVPGVVSDGQLHLVRRETSVQHDHSGEKITEQSIEETNPGNPSSGLQVTSKSSEVVQAGSVGKQRTRTFQVRDANGTFNVIGVETQKIELSPATPSHLQTPPH